MSLLFRTAPLLACFCLIAGCASNPTGGVDFVTMSESREIELGAELHEEILTQMPVYQDAELQAYVNRIGQDLASTSHRSDIEYHFTVIDSPDINAFATPGGYVYINRGLMAFMTNEAQLAAVLAHEIAHITARHSVRQQSARQTSNVVSIAMILATGVREMGETTSLLGGALLSGYGRDMELEADSLGAEYLLNAGYDPMAMVDVIGVLKNHEDFTKRTSSNAPSYHGVFATHPRNDVRLQEAVRSVGSLSEQNALEIDPAEFRRVMDGLPLGPSTQVAGSEARNRYYQNLLNYTLVFPDNWTWSETTTTLAATAPDQSSSLRISAQRLQQMKEPRLFIQEDLGISNLQETEALSQFGLQGYTGINPADDSRLAVIYYGPRAFIFNTSTSADDGDALLMSAIRSFRPIARNERAFSDPLRLSFVVSDGSTYATLAQRSRLQEHSEDLLRLYNGNYPFGEPVAGQWIKVVE